MTDAAKPVVLVVDDDAIQLDIITLMLGDTADVMTDESGAAAILHIRGMPAGSHPDAALIDLRMPGLAGPSLIASLRECCPEMHIVGMSASPPSDEVAGLLDAFLVKPLTPESLHAAVFHVPEEVPETPALDTRSEDHTHPEVLAKLESMMDPEAMQRLVRIYFDDAEHRLRTLHECEHNHDAPCAALASHALKGSSGMMGFTRMAALASSLEEHTTWGDLGSIGQSIYDMEEELRLLHTLLNA